MPTLSPTINQDRPADQERGLVLVDGDFEGHADLAAQYDTTTLHRQLGELGTVDLVELDNIEEQSIELQRARNAQMTSDIHTLLSSLPPDQVLGMLRRFTELGGTFSVGEMIKIKEQDEVKQGVTLEQLLTRAEGIVGGEDRAAGILQYPGVTTDQDPELVRPARTNWLEAFEEANTYGPQMDALIATKVGYLVFEDIIAGRASWQDVMHGYLNKDQVLHQKELVAKLHSAFRAEPTMPAGHAHHKTLYTIPDARFGYLWREFTVNYVNMGRAVADWVEQAEGITLPQAGQPTVGKGGEAVIDPANAARLDALFGNKEFRPYIDTFIKLYAAAEKELDSERGQTLQKEHRMQMNSRRGRSPDGFYNYALNLVVRKSVVSRIDELRHSGTLSLPYDLEQRFMENIEEPEE